MSTYPKYPEYKDSNVTWLGKVPIHWSVKRIKNIASYNDETLDEKTDPDFELEYVDISSVSLVKGIERTELMAFEKAPSRARRKVKHGDTIVSTVRTYLKAIAAINHPPQNMIVSTGFAVIRPFSKLNPNFVGYLLQTDGFVGNVVANSVGVSYPAINASVLATLPAIEPSVEEQVAIARFLNHKTAQIDALIAKKESLLAKLAEKRTALISHAVTKGLDPTVPMKDSNILWLGEIPIHWASLRLKFASENVLTGTTPPNNEIQYFEDGEVNWYGPSDFSDGILVLKDSKKKINGLAIATKKVKEIPANSILIIGIGATLGKVGLVLERSTSNQQINSVIPNKKITSKYLLYSLFVKQEAMRVISNSTTLGIMNQEKTKLIPMAIPQHQEQDEIVAYIEKNEARYALATQKIGEVIERLKEYRSALITNAVTGKIDVRHVAIPSSGAADA